MRTRNSGILIMRHYPHNFCSVKFGYAGRVLITLACFYGFSFDASACCYDSTPSQDSSGGSSEAYGSSSSNRSDSSLGLDSGSVSPGTSASDDETASYEQTKDSSDRDNANTDGGLTGSSLPVLKRPSRENMLVKKWRAEFSRRDVFDAVTGQPLNVDDAVYYLQNIEENLAMFSDQDFPVISRDLHLLEEWINHALDKRVPQKPLRKRLSFDLFRPSKIDAPAIIKKLVVLEFKHDMLVYGNSALQAMGVFVK